MNWLQPPCEGCHAPFSTRMLAVIPAAIGTLYESCFWDFGGVFTSTVAQSDAAPCCVTTRRRCRDDAPGRRPREALAQPRPTSEIPWYTNGSPGASLAKCCTWTGVFRSCGGTVHGSHFTSIFPSSARPWSGGISIATTAVRAFVVSNDFGGFARSSYAFGTVTYLQVCVPANLRGKPSMNSGA
ncbi:MAG: hypothetical protein HMLKMBBP_00528 [Planctomycetes bacterium]|nr:hypothetical protein [Planctomycetota bacterium]